VIITSNAQTVEPIAAELDVQAFAGFQFILPENVIPPVAILGRRCIRSGDREAGLVDDGEIRGIGVKSGSAGQDRAIQEVGRQALCVTSQSRRQSL
jgi:hypothetical protein